MGEDGPHGAPETTRHFVATVYVVNDGATALHRHDRLDMWLPPGGHVERDELPHVAAEREVEEELGLSVDLVAPVGDFDTATVTSIPRPQHFLLEDINVHEDGAVGHQHVDFIFYGRVSSREIEPGDDEQAEDDWTWLTPGDVEDMADALEPDVEAMALEAIRTVDNG